MDNLQFQQFVFLSLGALSIAGLVFNLTWPYLSGEKQTEKRIKGVVDNISARASRGMVTEQVAQRKQDVADTLKSIEEQQKKSQKVTLRTRLRRAGLNISVNTFYVVSAICGLSFAALVFLFVPSFTPGALAVIALVGMFGFPRWVLSFLIKRRQVKFLNELANAIDVIVRGVKSGLPLNECLDIVARESADPLAAEFREVISTHRVGVPLIECFERLCLRMPVTEIRFFTIVISIQQSAGGNLSEALGNLSNVLRSRKQLKAKVGALSAEAKASAVVLASLPFAVMGIILTYKPSYLEPLWTHSLGQLMLGGALLWMLIGALIMKKMIDFKY